MIWIKDITINPDFLELYLETFKNEMLKLAIGSTQKALTIVSLEKLKVKYPNIQEQRKIANFFEVLDNKIRLLSEKYNYYIDFKKYLMQQIFAQKLRFDFVEVKLKDISKINKGEQLNKDVMIEDGKYYVLNGGKDPSGYTNEWNVSENTITMSEGGNSCGYVNFNTEKFWSGGHCYTIQDIVSDVETLYLYHYLKSKEDSIMKLRIGTGLPNIQKKDLAEFKVIIPAIEQQRTISNILSLLERKNEIEGQLLIAMRTEKQHLLRQMFI